MAVRERFARTLSTARSSGAVYGSAFSALGASALGLPLASAVATCFLAGMTMSVIQPESASGGDGLPHIPLRHSLGSLTGAEAFLRYISRRLEGAGAGAVAVALIAIEGWSHLEKSCGAAACDEVTGAIASAIARASGPATRAFRLRGGEFGVVVHRAQGGRLSSLLRQVGTTSVNVKACGNQHAVKLSLGYASCFESEGVHSLISRAEARRAEIVNSHLAFQRATES